MKNFAQQIIELQHNYTDAWHKDETVPLPDHDLQKMIVEQHKCNFDLWHDEDKARDPVAQDSTIAQVKRNIDGFNQQRNDLITEIDVRLQEHELSEFQDDSLPWNSETIGSIIDRLSIASLKVFHMQEQAERNDASSEHIEACKQKTYQLEVQRQDLGLALQTFIDDIINRRKQNKLYRQFKMYNDPTLNPKIYGIKD